MSPRFPQEIFDYIIDNNQFEDEVLRTYSTVCKGWAIRSRSHLFAQIFFSTPDNLEMWRKAIPPTVDGPSQLVRVLYVYSEVLPLVHGSQPLDPYLDHLSALTQVVGLVLGSYHDKVDLGMAFQCFSGFRSSLRWIKLSSNSFRFEEMSRILEYFPNLEGLALWSPSSPRSSENEPFPPLRRASFPHLNHLDFHLLSGSPSLELHILSGFAEASMDLEILSVLGPVSDPSVVQKLVDSSARSLTDLTLTPLELDLSACDKIQHIAVEELLHSYPSTYFLRDSPTKPQFEHMLSTIQSPTLRAVSVRIKTNMPILIDDDEAAYAAENEEEVLPPINDWTHVDMLVCDILIRVRKRAQNPSWTFSVRLTGGVLYKHGFRRFEVEKFLPDFQAMGGVVDFLCSVEY